MYEILNTIIFQLYLTQWIYLVVSIESLLLLKCNVQYNFVLKSLDCYYSNVCHGLRAGGEPKKIKAIVTTTS